MIEVGTGYCIAFDETGARGAGIENSKMLDYFNVPTPDDPATFFKWAASRILAANENGAQWAVVSVPGQTEELAGQVYVGPTTHIHGLNAEKYNLSQELGNADRAAYRLLEGGFPLVPVRDEALAAHAVAARVKIPATRVGALINGARVGFGAVERDSEDPSLVHTIALPRGIGHMPIGKDPARTYQNTISEPALLKKYGESAENIPLIHHAWDKVGKIMARLSIVMACTQGIELVVPTGTIGASAVEKYGFSYKRFLSDYVRRADYDRETRRSLVPRIALVVPQDVKGFEMFGAESVMCSHIATLAAEQSK